MKIITKETLFMGFGIGTGLLSVSITSYVVFNFINGRFNSFYYTINEVSLYGIILGLPIILFCGYKLKKLRGRK